MHADCAVLTGRQHTASAIPCQDYAWAEAGAESALALVADGCSTGGETDLGARAWALAARRWYGKAEASLADPVAVRDRLLALAEASLRELPFEDGFATLGLLHARDGLVRALFFGDGALLVRRRDGSSTLMRLACSANAPDYLAYRRMPGQYEAWQQAFPGQQLAVTTWHSPRPGLPMVRTDSTRPVADGPWQWEANIEQAGIELALITTDGLPGHDGVLAESAQQLLGVRSITGEFLKRRLGRMGRVWAAEGLAPTDDLAVAGIWFGAGADDG